MIYLFKPHALHASSYLLKSRATYLFPDMKHWGNTDTCLQFRWWKAALQWHLVLCVVLYSSMWLCVEILHKENSIIGGSLCLGNWGFLYPPLLWSVNREPLFPRLSRFSFHREKVQLSIFTCAPRNSSSHPCILFIYHISVPISYLHFHLKSTVLYIYYDYTRFFFLLWMFLCCTPSYLVVYWLLSCGMFVLSQSNVVFTLKPHFS